MDEIELLVEETFKHFSENFDFLESEQSLIVTKKSMHDSDSLPERPGIIYHVQKTGFVFVIRALVSKNIQRDYLKILDCPEDYPSLRLMEVRSDLQSFLKFFMVENPSEAEIIHDQIHNRRFPVHEEIMCNLSDPGFSWWLTKKENGFQLSFTMSVTSIQNPIKLGPLGDREIALRKFQNFEELINSAGIGMNIQNEMNRVQFTDCEEFILEELKDIFEFGVINQTLKDLFKILARETTNVTLLEETWFYLHELAAMRRFWIQIQYDLNEEIYN